MTVLARIAMALFLDIGISMKTRLKTVEIMSLLMVGTLVCGTTMKTPLSQELGRRMMAMLKEPGMLKKMNP
jgi:hypothetical protein